MITYNALSIKLLVGSDKTNQCRYYIELRVEKMQIIIQLERKGLFYKERISMVIDLNYSTRRSRKMSFA